jgi:hypothetical protein
MQRATEAERDLSDRHQPLDRASERRKVKKLPVKG